MNNLKILVGCHKPCKCPDFVKDNPDIYIPILAGADVSGLEPFWPGMIKDNYFDNISWMNPYYSEFTCLYWAWKNYDMIGNPEYIGFNQYSRYLDLTTILPNLQPDNVFAYILHTIVTNYEHLWCSEGNDEKLNLVCSTLNDVMKDTTFDAFMNATVLPACSIFVAHKDVFHRLMEFLYPFMKQFCVHIEFNEVFDKRNCRYFSFIFERLLGYFFLLQRFNKLINLNQVNIITQPQ